MGLLGYFLVFVDANIVACFKKETGCNINVVLKENTTNPMNFNGIIRNSVTRN